MLTRARAARYLSDFDSSVNSVRAVGSFLHGKDHGGLSMGPSSRFLADTAAVSPPDRLRAMLFRAAGFTQGIPLDRVRAIDIDDLDHWVVKQYGEPQYPAVVIGSASGGVVHLAAALGAPFLPQTTLVGVRDLISHADDVVGAMDALAPTTRLIARNNPRTSVYHMHDPAQDRPMLEAMAYMRLKRRSLGAAYEKFLTERLAPGGTIIQVECTRDWRVHQVGDRAYFQFGCLGGVPEDEYHSPGERIAKYLEQERSPVRTWEPPEMETRVPEAEWGWDPAMGEDIAEVARRNDYRLRRLVSREPQEHSHFVADLYRWWYAQLGRPTDRLLVESYVQWDPLWTVRLGAVPFWCRFNMGPAFDELKAYLEHSEPYDYIHVNLFSQGIESPGVVAVEQWEDLVRRHARKLGEVIGVDRDTYPMDLGSTLRFQKAFEAIPSRQPSPGRLPLADLDRFFVQSGRAYPVSWE